MSTLVPTMMTFNNTRNQHFNNRQVPPSTILKIVYSNRSHFTGTLSVLCSDGVLTDAVINHVDDAGDDLQADDYRVGLKT